MISKFDARTDATGASMSRVRQGGFLLAKIHRLSGRIFSSMLKARAVDLNPAQGRIMFALWERDGVPVHELAGATALTASTLTRMLDRLEASGHVLRASPDADRRQVLVHLTEQNKTMKAAYHEVSAQMTELFYQGFSDAEIDECERYLRRILDNLTNREHTTNGRHS